MPRMSFSPARGELCPGGATARGDAHHPSCRRASSRTARARTTPEDEGAPRRRICRGERTIRAWIAKSAAPRSTFRPRRTTCSGADPCRLVFVVKKDGELQAVAMKAPDGIDPDEFFASFTENLGFEDDEEPQPGSGGRGRGRREVARRCSWSGCSARRRRDRGGRAAAARRPWLSGRPPAWAAFFSPSAYKHFMRCVEARASSARARVRARRRRRGAARSADGASGSRTSPRQCHASVPPRWPELVRFLLDRVAALPEDEALVRDRVQSGEAARVHLRRSSSCGRLPRLRESVRS